MTVRDAFNRSQPYVVWHEAVDDQGRFRVRVDKDQSEGPLEVIEVIVSHPAFVSVPVSKTWTGQALNFEMARRAHVRGRVVDANGNALAGVRVGVYVAGQYVSRGFTNADGVYEADGPGVWCS